MKLIPIICGLVCLFVTSAFSQELSPDTLKKIRAEVTKSDNFQTKQNVLTHSPVGPIATSRINEEGFDRDFSHVIKRGVVTNQERSGRCWLFAGLNVVRYDVAQRLGIKDFEFSENHLFFFHKLELSNYLLEQAITGKMDPNDPEIAWLLRNGLGDGGYWDMFVYLFNKHGAVPKSVMPETQHSSNTKDLNDLLEKLVKKHVIGIWDLRQAKVSVSEMRAYKLKGIKEIYQLLALLLGTPPESFEWRYTDKDGFLRSSSRYTPQSFARQYASGVVSTKVHLMSDPSLPYYNRYILKGLKNVAEADEEAFLNVPVDILLESAKKSVLSNKPVWFGSDVGRYADFKSGILDVNNFDYEELLGIKIELPKASRLKVYASAATHAMVLMGVDLDIYERPTKWLVENSWGASAGDGGYLIMTSKWFKEYAFDAIVDKMFVSSDILDALDKPIIELPLWHHLWRN